MSTNPERQSFTNGGIMGTILSVCLVLAVLRSPSSALSVFALFVLFVALFILFVFCTWFIAGPISLHKNHRMALEPNYTPFNPEDALVPEPVRSSVESHAPRLAALGFKALGQFVLTASVPNGTGNVALFENRTTRQSAKLLTTILQSKLGVKRATFLLFLTEFTDGTRLATTNNSTVMLLPPAPCYREGTISFPELSDPARLYEIHNASITRFASDGIRQARNLSDQSSLRKHLQEVYNEEMEQGLSVGHTYMDSVEGAYRLTWKGAFLPVWLFFPPVLWFRKRMKAWRARRILREIGMA